MKHSRVMPRAAAFRRAMVCVSCVVLLIGTTPEPLRAQTPPPPPADQADSQGFSIEQLDALLAPIALYPDELLTQILMASTYPLQVVDAARWADDPANKTLKGDALTAALVKQSWDPAVKSIVPFPQVLTMMNSKLDWLQQLGYAMTVQQKAVMDSIQRLRRQAQTAGQLNTTPQQVVRSEGQDIVIASAQQDTVYVPQYNPTTVYGTWPYPSYPPVYLPPPPGYVVGTALVSGLAFGVGVAVTAGLWGWARPNWSGGNVNVNVNRYNNINVNRRQINNANWHPNNAANRPGGGGFRPPSGPVGAPARPGGLPSNGIGRPSVSAPGSVVRPPNGMGPGNKPGINPGGPNRPGGGQIGNGPGNRPGGAGGAGANRPNLPGGGAALGPGNRPGGPGTNRPNVPGGGQVNRPVASPRPTPAARPVTRPAAPGAFNGMNSGRAAAQYGNRGAQSRQFNAPQRGGGGRAAGGGARAGGGGGRGRGR